MLESRVRIGGRWRTVAWSRPIDLAPPLTFSNRDAAAFGLPDAQQKPFRVDGFVGSTKEGGSVNCRVLTLAPHGNGTHTESVWHITDDGYPVGDIAPRRPVLAWVGTVVPQPLDQTDDGYDAPQAPGDLVLTAERLAPIVDAAASAGAEALILHARPGMQDPTPRWSGGNPPYFSREGMAVVAEGRLSHLLVDLPSVDRAEDEGKLPAHHRWWSIEPGSRTMIHAPLNRRWRTITELIFVPHDLPDGAYLLDLQIPNWHTDAAPSRPLLYPLLDAT